MQLEGTVRMCHVQCVSVSPTAHSAAHQARRSELYEEVTASLGQSTASGHSNSPPCERAGTWALRVVFYMMNGVM